MANKKLEIMELRRILRLHGQGKSDRFIAEYLGLSRNTVSKYIGLFKVSGYTIDGLLCLNDEQLNDIVNPIVSTRPQKAIDLEKLFPVLDQKLRRAGMTKQKVWEEYRKDHPEGYRYTQFRHYYNLWRDAKKPSMRMIHKPGDKMYIDYTGHKMRLVDKLSGKKTEVEIFVAVLGASQYTYIEASPSQKKEDFIKSVENALHFFDGVPEAIVPDNLKSAVTKPNRYEPTLNESFYYFAEHYATVIFPARVRKPKDKALAENAVGISYSRIFAPLDKKVFFNLKSLNEAIWEKLEEYNATPLTNRENSRKELFEEFEKEALNPLPPTRYDMKYSNPGTVYKNYHVYLREDKHYYSVPYQYIGKKVKVVYTQDLVEVYYKYTLIAFHGRNRTPQGFTTIKDHMPSKHQHYANQSPERFIKQADEIGTHTRRMVMRILETSRYAESAYRSCSGLFNLSKKVGNVRLENACRRALEFEVYTYEVVKNILAKDMDKYHESDPKIKQLPKHGNIRGKKNYK